MIRIRCDLQTYAMFYQEWELYKKKYRRTHMSDFLQDMIRAWRIYKNKLMAD